MQKSENETALKRRLLNGRTFREENPDEKLYWKHFLGDTESV